MPANFSAAQILTAKIRAFFSLLVLFALVGCAQESTPIQLFEPKPLPESPLPDSPPPAAERPDQPQEPEEPGRPSPTPGPQPGPTPGPTPAARTHYLCEGSSDPSQLLHFHSAMSEASRSRRYTLVDPALEKNLRDSRRSQLIRVSPSSSQILFMGTEQGTGTREFVSQLYWAEVQRSHMSAEAVALTRLPPLSSLFGNDRAQQPLYYTFLGANRVLLPIQSPDQADQWFYSLQQLRPLQALVHLSLDPRVWKNPVHFPSSQVILFERPSRTGEASQFGFLDLRPLLQGLPRGGDAVVELTHLPQARSRRHSPPQLSTSGHWLWLEQPEAQGPVFLRRWQPGEGLGPETVESLTLNDHSSYEFLQILGRGSQEQILTARIRIERRPSDSRYELVEGAFDLYQWSNPQQALRQVNSIDFPIQVASSLGRVLPTGRPPALLYDLVSEGDGQHFVATLRTSLGSQLFRFNRLSRGGRPLGESSCRFPSILREGQRW